MNSAIYSGFLQHCRHRPKHHRFRYAVFMVYLDLAELDQVFAMNRAWSHRVPTLAWLRRKDFIGDSATTIADAVKQRIKEEFGEEFRGSVRMLANLRYFGFLMNPIVCYYCFDEEEGLAYVIAEVTNTPWRERHAYVLKCDRNSGHQRIRFGKALHVSPFNDMEFEYEWLSGIPGDHLSVRLVNWRGEERWFEAALVLHRREINRESLRAILFQYPLMTLKVCLGIYWQALRIFLKGIPFVAHSKKIAKSSRPGI